MFGFEGEYEIINTNSGTFILIYCTVIQYIYCNNVCLYNLVYFLVVSEENVKCRYIMPKLTIEFTYAAFAYTGLSRDS